MANKGSSNQSQVYKLKKDQDYTKKLRNLHAYTEEQLAHIKSEMKEALLFLGYTTDPNPDNTNECGFFEYDSYDEKDRETYMGFRKHNE